MMETAWHRRTRENRTRRLFVKFLRRMALDRIDLAAWDDGQRTPLDAVTEALAMARRKLNHNSKGK